MHVSRLSTTPIKGLGLNHPDSIQVSESGAAGDRQFFLIDERNKMTSVAATGALFDWRSEYDPDTDHLALYSGDTLVHESDIFLGEPIEANFFDAFTVEARLVDGDWSSIFSEHAGIPLRFCKADKPNGARDVDPMTLLGTASTEELARRSGLDSVDPDRFRMLIEFDGGRPHEEDEWNGRRLKIGDVVVTVAGPVQRCAGTTRNPVSGDIDLQTLKLIGDYRGRQESILGLGFNFGVYATAEAPGTIRMGDELTLLD